jgi:hypothetical protein
MLLKYFIYGLLLTAFFHLIMASSCDDNLTNPKSDQNVEESLTKAENAFLSGDTTQLKTVMTPTAINFYKDDYSGISQVMKTIGTAMKNRTIKRQTTNIAEVEVSYQGQSFILIFALQEDESWKLVRF